MSGLALGELVLLRPLWLLPALLIILLAARLRVHTGSSDWHRVLSSDMFRFLGGDRLRLRQVSLALLAAFVASLALSKPALRQSDDDTWRHTIGWVVLADVSRSMTLDDTAPSRLAAMREALSLLADAADSRPISLILFAGDAFLVVPPAFDLTLYREHAALLDYGVIPVDGSNLARALSLATAVIEDSRLLRARVFVLGDTGGIGKSSLAAARHLADAGHRVDTLVFGKRSQQQASSETIDETAVDLEQATALARAGNGKSLQGNTLGVIDYSELDLSTQTSASEHADLQSLVWREQSHWLLLLAIPLLLLLFRQEQRGP